MLSKRFVGKFFYEFTLNTVTMFQVIMLLFLISGAIVGYVWYDRLSEIQLTKNDSLVDPNEGVEYVEVDPLRASTYVPDMRAMLAMNDRMTASSKTMKTDAENRVGELKQQYDAYVEDVRTSYRPPPPPPPPPPSPGSDQPAPPPDNNKGVGYGDPCEVDSPPSWSEQVGSTFVTVGDDPVVWVTDFQNAFDDERMVDYCKSVCMAHDNCKAFEHARGAKSCALMGGDDTGRHVIYSDPSSTLFRKSCVQAASQKPPLPSYQCGTDGYADYSEMANMYEHNVGSYLFRKNDDAETLHSVCKDVCRDDSQCRGFLHSRPISSAGPRPMCMFHKTGNAADNLMPVTTSHTNYVSSYKCSGVGNIAD